MEILKIIIQTRQMQYLVSRVFHREAAETHLFVWLLSESWGARQLRQKCAGTRWSCSRWTHTRGLTGSALHCTALCSSFRVSETNSSSAPSLPFTRTVAATEGRLGGCRLSDQHKSLPHLSLLPALCLSSSKATGNHGWRDEQKNQCKCTD